MLHKAHDFIKNSQVKKNSSGNIQSWYRHISRGGWPFSTPDNGWPVSDCTAEALKTVLMLSQMPHDIVGEAIARECLYDAVYLLLTLQVMYLKKPNNYIYIQPDFFSVRYYTKKL